MVCTKQSRDYAVRDKGILPGSDLFRRSGFNGQRQAAACMGGSVRSERCACRRLQRDYYHFGRKYGWDNFAGLYAWNIGRSTAGSAGLCFWCGVLEPSVQCGLLLWSGAVFGWTFGTVKTAYGSLQKPWRPCDYGQYCRRSVGRTDLRGRKWHPLPVHDQVDKTCGRHLGIWLYEFW